MLMLMIRKRQLRTKQASNESSPGYGQKSRSSIDDMECPQLLSNDEMVRKVMLQFLLTEQLKSCI